MSWFRAKLPILNEDREWVESGFERLSKALGHHRLIHAQVILPNDHYFPDPYDASEEAAKALFHRLGSYMKVSLVGIEFHVFPDESAELKKLLPSWSGKTRRDCAGFYAKQGESDTRMVAVRKSKLKDPLLLVATLAHELGHEILLGGKLIDANSPDMEPLTDLLTVFLGLGVFNANAAGHFRQFHNETQQGWSVDRLGYLPQQMYGYALALFEAQRGEKNPPWAKYLSPNVKADFERSRKWLQQNRATMVTAAGG